MPGCGDRSSWTIIESSMPASCTGGSSCEDLSSQLQNTDGSHIYEYTVGDPTLEITIPITYLDAQCTNPATINAPTHSGPVDLIVANGLNYEISITDPATFTSYASFDGEITTVTISDSLPASQDIQIEIFNPCFTSAFDASTVFTSPTLDSAGYDVYLGDPSSASTFNIG